MNLGPASARSVAPVPRTGMVPRTGTGPAAGALVVDALAVLVFAAVGRASHAEDVFGGLFVTAWPFLVALLAGWLVLLAWRAPFAIVRVGLPLWAITVAGGMLLRWASGQGVQVAFVIVAAVVLLLFLVGWRALGTGIRRLRDRRRR